MSGARVRFSGDATDLVRAQEDVARGAKKMEDAIAATGREARRLERIASKAFHESATEQEKAERKARDLNKAWKEGYLSTEIYERQIKKLNEGLRATAVQQQKVADQPDKMASSIAAAAAGYLGISETLGLIINQTNNWFENQKKIAREAQTAALDVVAFAALQDDSAVIRERTMKAIQAGAGVASAGESLNLVQSMQSAFGWDKGLAVSQDIFKTVQAGVPIDVATNLAKAASGQGLDPSRFVRAGFAAGQASPSDPGTVGRAVSGLAGFDDKDFGWLVAAQGSANYPGQLETYTKNIGLALSSISALGDTFDKLGVGEGATREQRLRALSAAGLNTAESLVGAGLTDTTKAIYLADLVSSVSSGGFDKSSAKFREIIADPNLIAKKRGMIEEGLVETELQRNIAESRSRVALQRRFGPRAIQALSMEQYQQFIVEKLQDIGVQSWMGQQLYELGSEGEVESFNALGLGVAAGANKEILNAILAATREQVNATRSLKGDMRPITVTTQEK